MNIKFLNIIDNILLNKNKILKSVLINKNDFEHINVLNTFIQNNPNYKYTYYEKNKIKNYLKNINNINLFNDFFNILNIFEKEDKKNIINYIIDNISFKNLKSYNSSYLKFVENDKYFDSFIINSINNNKTIIKQFYNNIYELNDNFNLISYFNKNLYKNYIKNFNYNQDSTKEIIQIDCYNLYLITELLKYDLIYNKNIDKNSLILLKTELINIQQKNNNLVLKLKGNYFLNNKEKLDTLTPFDKLFDLIDKKLNDSLDLAEEKNNNNFNKFYDIKLKNDSITDINDLIKISYFNKIIESFKDYYISITVNYELTEEQKLNKENLMKLINLFNSLDFSSINQEDKIEIFKDIEDSLEKIKDLQKETQNNSNNNIITNIKILKNSL